MNTKAKRIMISLMITTMYTLIYIFSDLHLSHAGDKNIAGYLASDTTPGYYFISPYIAYLLNFCYQIFSQISWWTIFSIASVSILVFVIIYISIQSSDNKLFKFVVIATFLVFVWIGICEEDINFTHTSACFTISGMAILIWNGYRNSKYSKIYCIIGSVLLMTGWFVRWTSALLCIPFGVMIGLEFALDNHDFKEFNIRKFISNHRGIFQIVTVSLTTIFLMVFYGMVNPEWLEYYEANQARSSIYDYYDQYPVYQENAKLYESVNATESMIDMISNNLTADDNYFSSQKLEEIGKLKYPSHITIQSARTVIDTFLSKPLCIIAIMIILIAFGFKSGRKVIRSILLQMIALFICGLYLAYIGRVNWRVVVCSMLAYIVCTILVMLHYENIVADWKNKVVGILGIVLAILGIEQGIRTYDFSIPHCDVSNKIMHEQLEYINDHKDNIYVVVQNVRFYDAHTVWDSPQKDYCNNLISHHANFVRGQNKLLEEKGIDNLFEAMLTRDDILSEYNEVLYNYLKEMYDPCTTVSVIDKIDGLTIVRYMAPFEINAEIVDQKIDKINVDIDENQLFFTVYADTDENYAIDYLEIYVDNSRYVYACQNELDNVLSEGIIPLNLLNADSEIKAYLVDMEKNEKLAMSEYFSDVR